MMLQAELSLAKVCAWNRQGWVSQPGGTAAQLAAVGRVVCSPGSRDIVGQCHLPADSHRSARTSARQQSPVMPARNLWAVRTTCSSSPAVSWANEETDVTGTAHWAPPACSWPEVQPNIPAPISREQAAALKLSKTGVGKNVLPREREALHCALPKWWDLSLQVPRGSSLCQWSPCPEQPWGGCPGAIWNTCLFQCLCANLGLDKPPKGLAASCFLILNICRTSATTQSV